MERERTFSALLWRIVALVTAATAGAMIAAGLSFDWRSAVIPVAACLGLAPLIWLYRYRRRDDRIATALDCVAQLVAFSAVGLILSYVAASTDHPLWDSTFREWDRALGLNWRAYLAFVNARPWLGGLFSVAYQSLELQIIVLLLALSFQGKLLACREFVMAFVVSCLATVFVFWLAPAMGMYDDLGLHHARDFPNLSPVGGLSYLPDLSALRDGAMRAISLKNPQGIVSFPSFHAVLGVILSFAFWNCFWLRWPAIVLNVVLIASTPIEGGHYFVDLLAGVAIGLLSLAFARGLSSRWNSDREISSTTDANSQPLSSGSA